MNPDDRRSGARWIAGGSFRIGAEHTYPEGAPGHTVMAASFWMDNHTVTNADLAKLCSGHWLSHRCRASTRSSKISRRSACTDETGRGGVFVPRGGIILGIAVSLIWLLIVRRTPRSFVWAPCLASVRCSGCSP
jgi:hypothetical protein